MLKKIELWKLNISDEILQLLRKRRFLGVNIYYLRNYRWIFFDDKFKNKLWISIEDFKFLEDWRLEVDIETLYNISQTLKIDIELFFNNDINWWVVEIIDYYFKQTKEIELDFNKIIHLIYLIEYEYFKKNNDTITWMSFFLDKNWLFNEKLFEIKKFFNKIENNCFKIKRWISIKNNVILEDKEIRIFLNKMFEKYSDFNWDELKELVFKTEPLLKYNNKDEMNKNIWIEVKFN